MTAQTASVPAARPAPNLMFSHMGLSVCDLDLMERFYTSILGFTVTDRGEIPGMQIVFLSRNPMDHHQIVLATGRPDVMPQNTANPQFGPSINQISFKMGSIADLRDIKQRLEAWGGDALKNMMPANHGIAWSVYAHDPEGNNLEFFVDSNWYIDQPFLIPLDFTKTDEELYEQTRTLCQGSAGFEPYGDWRDRVARRMTPFMAPPFREN